MTVKQPHFVYNATNRFIQQSTYKDNIEILTLLLSESKTFSVKSNLIIRLDFGHLLGLDTCSNIISPFFKEREVWEERIKWNKDIKFFEFSFGVDDVQVGDFSAAAHCKAYKIDFLDNVRRSYHARLQFSMTGSFWLNRV